MIKYLHLVNFRRHADLELRFDDDRQLILIAGGNGVGKSTILEGIQFAFWGESRHGRRGLQGLVKRGSELEGTTVELVFTVAGEEYRVHRRRDGKASTAVLYVNDTPLVEGPLQVTEEISKLMGMDSAGFRLAVVAQQKDLDGLASLRPAERAQMVTRLLRLDALTAAKTEAGVLFRRERDLAVALRGEDVSVIELEVAKATAEHQVAVSELDRARASLAVLEAELAMSADVEAAWVAATSAVARIDGAIAQLSEQVVTRQAELEALVIPDALDGEAVDVAAVSSELGETERAIAHGEAAKRTAEQAHSLTSELERVHSRLESIDRELNTPAPDMGVLTTDQSAAQRAVLEVEAEQASLQGALGTARALVAAAQDRLQRAQNQDAVCGECGQEVTAEHRADQQMRAITDLGNARTQVEELEAQLLENAEALTKARETLTQATEAVSQARQADAQRSRLAEEKVDLERRERSYASQLERLTVGDVDMDALYARKGELAMLMASAQEQSRSVQARATALARKEALRTAMDEARESLRARQDERDAAAPNADLEVAYAKRRQTQEAARDEADIVAHWTTREAVTGEQLSALKRRLDAASEQAKRQSVHQQQAAYAAAAGRLLNDVADRLATQIRPSLEGAVGTLLSQMSSGRFSTVSISPDYDILVEDDGKMRPLSELSGGEVDLVALAVRLALAQVVSDRHGSGGAGFLVLDECFGSQDPSRRAAILDALRTLRGTYSQIFLISHVENIEDSADVLVTVTASDDRQDTEVTVS